MAANGKALPYRQMRGNGWETVRERDGEVALRCITCGAIVSIKMWAMHGTSEAPCVKREDAK